jgi:hypothetical protein
MDKMRFIKRAEPVIPDSVFESVSDSGLRMAFAFFAPF